jgi:S1-C subfamily serine protease
MDASADRYPLCYDPSRNIIQRVMPGECTGREVTAEEAKEIRQKIRQERAEKFVKGGERTQPRQAGRKTGTGFYISREGHVMTARHVIQGCSEVDVQSASGEKRNATIKALHRDRDLALLKTGPTRDWISPWPKAQTRPGDNQIRILGYPFLGVPTTQVNEARGELLRDGTAQDRGALVMRADVRPGNSGGPVLSSDGRLRGIVVAKLDTPKFFQKTGRLQRHVAVGLRQEVIQDFLQSQDIFGGAGAQGVSRIENTEEKARRSVVRLSCSN